MKLMVEKLPDLQALYVKELRLLLSAEELIAIKMPIMVDAATDTELSHVFLEHLEETWAQGTRLREILQRITGDASLMKCRIIYSMFDEVEDLVQDAAHDPVRDAVLLTEARRLEHYEMAAYGALSQFAVALCFDADARLLDQALQEETRADLRLAGIAERLYPAARKAA